VIDPSAKKRINITLTDEVYEALGRLASERGQAVAGVGARLIEEALEYSGGRPFLPGGR
jgi:hypothetical protein